MIDLFAFSLIYTEAQAEAEQGEPVRFFRPYLLLDAKNEDEEFFKVLAAVFTLGASVMASSRALLKG